MGLLGHFQQRQILTAPPAPPETQQIQAQPTMTFTKGIHFHRAGGEDSTLQAVVSKPPHGTTATPGEVSVEKQTEALHPASHSTCAEQQVYTFYQSDSLSTVTTSPHPACASERRFLSSASITLQPSPFALGASSKSRLPLLQQLSSPSLPNGEPSIDTSTAKMVNIPKTRRTFCKKCGKQPPNKAIQCKKNRDSQGKRHETRSRVPMWLLQLEPDAQEGPISPVLSNPMSMLLRPIASEELLTPGAPYTRKTFMTDDDVVGWGMVV
ncbi:hypothetical protein A6R68_09079 [Neotoma lepida]|uniref:Uncharacterized protein n=1 Tax=Neotoma lepida TaxID=56216 RepID=A0A1A6G0U8_NEOLE|nr:hypothetical protein A6R68_09079 [Neotoma lepida]